MNNVHSGEFQEFIVENRKRINRYLNVILWFFIITGPAIAIGVGTGVFPDISFNTCIGISLAVVILAGVHLLLMKKSPNVMLSCIFALTALDILIVYMVFSHVNIYLTWFLVPLLSILFCDRRVYLYAVVLNYVLMCLTIWLSAPYYAAQRADLSGVTSYWLDTIGGFTIETLIMAVSGFIVVKLSMDHYREIFRKNELLLEKETSEREKLDILDSMAEIYDNVNLISFVDNTEMSLREEEQKKHGIDMNSQTHTLMNQRIKKQVMPDMLDDFLKFTNITTVRDRLKNRKIISGDFIDVSAGWFRAQYITVEQAPDGKPNVVIYTTRNVDEEKRREEHLIRLSMTDEMTRLYNRRCYETDLDEYRGKPLDHDFVVFSIDVNGLKKVNDTKGHSAGDELIKGAADCLALSLPYGGKAYRTGGDEFMALVHTETPEKIREEIGRKTGEWHGMYTDKMFVSVGYAAAADHPDWTVDELERAADADMYEKKENFYKEKRRFR